MPFPRAMRSRAAKLYTATCVIMGMHAYLIHVPLQSERVKNINIRNPQLPLKKKERKSEKQEGRMIRKRKLRTLLTWPTVPNV